MSRPEKKIDWELVDQLLEAGADGTEIAPHFDMHPETFYRRVQDQYGVGFTEYSQSKKSKGNSNLHLSQYKKALRGDSTMLKHLGEWRLGQKEKRNTDESNNFERSFVVLIGTIARENPQLYESLRPYLENQQLVLDQGQPGEPSEVRYELGSEGTL